MKKKLMMGLLCLFLTTIGVAQRLTLTTTTVADSLRFAQAVQRLAGDMLAVYKSQTDQKAFFETDFRLQLVAGNYAEARKSLASVRSLSNDSLGRFLYAPYDLFAEACLRQRQEEGSFSSYFSPLLTTFLTGLTDRQAVAVSSAFVSRNGLSA
ncbi:hypothetical protein GO730_01285 [Spirosoma sp. HMF3257]|uniref:Uncharacterized protein n=1 Tax=Spirosoma telluris TaxID=2183553 RepID=A0A327NLD8_9BACT|nr:hypothetical protein [Spirosoma telluris]RAI73398.1 hypothetical protein HMF3257_01260 [Spirosoma telluris]